MRSLSEGLATTFEVLTKTPNDAAVRVLLPALDSPYEYIQQEAMAALLTRRSPVGSREILRRLSALPKRGEEILREYPGRMTGTLRDALLGPDRQMFENACRAVTRFGEYDLVPALLTALEDRRRQNSDLAAETLLALVDRLYEQLASPHDFANRRDPQLIRRNIVSSLESSLKRFGRHERREAVEAFLLLVGRDNVTLKQTLRDPHHAAFLTMVDVLSNSPRGGVIRLLLSLFDDHRAPSAAISVVAKRSDPKFVQHLLRKIGREPSGAVKSNLKKVHSIDWLQSEPSLLDELDETAQHAAVRLVMASGIPRLDAFATIKRLLLYGKPGGRREAAVALAEFSGADANATALEALDDPDPQVQSTVVLQLRSRGIPGILPRLVQMVEIPHAVVRQAVREALVEFTFERFIGAFDMLDDEARRSTGMLVKKIDPQTLPQLKKELQSRLRTRRLRGLAVVQAIEVVAALEEVITGLLDDEDHLVRMEAANALAHGNSRAGREALQQALYDSSTTVQEAARRSLDYRAQFTQWREAVSDPRD